MSDDRTELQIRRKLQEYVQHKPECYLPRTILVDGKPLKKCTCGLEPILAKLKELEGV